MRTLLVATGTGAALCLAGLAIDPARAAASLLMTAVYLTGLGLGALFFMALGAVSGATWSTAIRRVPEALSLLVPAGALLVPVAWLGGGADLAPWLGSGAGMPPFRRMWLAPGFVLARWLLCSAAWTAFAVALRRASLRQDGGDGAAASRRMARLSAGFLVVAGVTVPVASFDWIMSLEPAWYSTILGVYNFAGLLVSALAAITLIVVSRRRTGPLAGVASVEHLHDLGRLLFAFSTFWMYIWFSQYMLIWYSHIPEETVYYARRGGAWGPLFVANILVNWAVPFVCLMPRPAKRNATILARVSLLLLVGRALDIYVMMGPPVMGATPRLGAWEAGAALLGIGGALLLVQRALAAAPPVPAGDPSLLESLHHHA